MQIQRARTTKVSLWETRLRKYLRWRSKTLKWQFRAWRLDRKHCGNPTYPCPGMNHTPFAHSVFHHFHELSHFNWGLQNQADWHSILILIGIPTKGKGPYHIQCQSGVRLWKTPFNELRTTHQPSFIRLSLGISVDQIFPLMATQRTNDGIPIWA